LLKELVEFLKDDKVQAALPGVLTLVQAGLNEDKPQLEALFDSVLKDKDAAYLASHSFVKKYESKARQFLPKLQANIGTIKAKFQHVQHLLPFLPVLLPQLISQLPALLSQASAILPQLENLVISIDDDGSTNPSELVAELVPCGQKCSMPSHSEEAKNCEEKKQFWRRFKAMKECSFVKRAVEYTTEGKPIHVGFSCDGCKGKIIGTRYHCGKCNDGDYDLCETCEAKGDHDPSHALLKFRHPPTGNVTAIHHGVSCDGCKASPIEGVRFKCSVCPNFDLCAKCEEAGNKHPSDHVLLKMKQPRMGHGHGHGMGHEHHGFGGGRHGHGHGHGGPRHFLGRLFSKLGFGPRGGCPFFQQKGQECQNDKKEDCANTNTNTNTTTSTSSAPSDQSSSQHRSQGCGGRRRHQGGFLNFGGCPRNSFTNILDVNLTNGNNTSAKVPTTEQAKNTTSTSTSSSSSSSSSSATTAATTQANKPTTETPKSETDVKVAPQVDKKEEQVKPSAPQISDEDKVAIASIRSMGFSDLLVSDEGLVAMLSAAKIKKGRHTPLQQVVESLLKL
jgi:hypothetical protein